MAALILIRRSCPARPPPSSPAWILASGRRV